MSDNLERNVIRSVAELVDFIKSQTRENLMLYSRESDIEMKDIQTISRLVDDSIMQAFTKGLDNVIKSIK